MAARAARSRRGWRAMSMHSRITATQTRQKPTRRSGGIGSLNTVRATMNCRIGARNCRVPRVVKGRRRADAPKSSSGTAVMTPLATMSQKCAGPAEITVSWFEAMSQTMTPRAGMLRTAVSMLSEVNAVAVRPTRFFTKP